MCRNKNEHRYCGDQQPPCTNAVIDSHIEPCSRCHDGKQSDEHYANFGQSCPTRYVESSLRSEHHFRSPTTVPNSFLSRRMSRYARFRPTAALARLRQLRIFAAVPAKVGCADKV
jgi:hypothetical protein